ncbi:Beta-barrel assembly-enhancing protease [Pandoraea anapnoica]|uniref:Beta-barrel assembly-enhancing protease n=1 Tax=Pandoraea anapnoica TaxID=2508301 RepID=A0A5E5A6N8_9BURK|nr:tetratricopeptide repeat protein [Pandoraea anapnoica]VVE68163.1 Beta-barrel assembly-enhancing protease [Pandoraea anapnoica]
MLTFPQAIARAHTHWQAGQAQQAEILCRRVLAVAPEYPDAHYLLGLMAHAYGKLEMAIGHLRIVCKPSGAPAACWSDLAEMNRQAGRIEDAMAAAQKAVEVDPTFAAGWNNLGIVQQEAGQLTQSLASLRRVSELLPGSADAQNNLGNTAMLLGLANEAEAHYHRALELDPQRADTHSNLAALLRRQQRLDEAADVARRAIEIDPQFVDAYRNLADVELARRNVTGALQIVEVMSAFAIGHPSTLVARACILRLVGRLDEALASACEAVRIVPESADARAALAAVEADVAARGQATQGDASGNTSGVPTLTRSARGVAAANAVHLAAVSVPDASSAEAAKTALHATIAARVAAHDYAGAETMLRELVSQGAAPMSVWRSLAMVLRSQGKTREGCEVLDMLARQVPGDLSNRFDLAEALLLRGDFERGWQEYRYRYSLEHTQSIERKVQRPRWDGSPIPGKTLLIHDEQGYGDTFQFMRMARWARERSRARVIFEVNHEALSIARRMWGDKDIVARGTLTEPFDMHCELMSLPMAMGLRLEDLPGEMPYLSADPERVAVWRERLANVPRPWVATVWAGRPEHVNDHNRSISLDSLAPLGASGATFLSIQKGPAAAQAATPPAGLSMVSLSDEIRDFEDTAAILHLSDLLVSIDSSPVHLAGAMGRPVWVLLPFVPDWRWLEVRNDSPWYPEMTLFRQSERAAWAPVIDRMGRALAAFVAERRDTDSRNVR